MSDRATLDRLDDLEKRLHDARLKLDALNKSLAQAHSKVAKARGIVERYWQRDDAGRGAFQSTIVANRQRGSDLWAMHSSLVELMEVLRRA